MGDASLIYPSLHCGRKFKDTFFVSLCVSAVFFLALTSLVFGTLEAGAVPGQNRRESSMDPASHTGPRRLSGQALQDQLADGCLRIMARWHLQSEQVIRLTVSPWPTGETKLPVLNLPLPLLQLPSGYTHKLPSVTEVYWFTKFLNCPERGVRMCWKKENSNRFYVGVWIELSFIHQRVSRCLYQCQMTLRKFVSEPCLSFFILSVIPTNSPTSNES